MAPLRSKIMVVDDEAEVRAVFAEYLDGEGFDVVTAAGGVEALQKLVNERPQAVLLDLMMPDMNGLDVLREMRARHADLGVLMVSANDDATKAQEAVALGAFDYVLKPVDFANLRRALDRMLISNSMPGLRAAPAPSPGGLVYDLTLELFRATRQLSPSAHASLGVALETAALNIVQKNSAGDKAEVVRALGQVRTLIRFGRDLGDFTDDVHRQLESFAVKARQSLGLS